MAISYLDKADFENQKVIARFDFNVPLDKKTGEILDSTRIDLALPTIKYILQNNPKKLILISHLGRPKGKKDPALSLSVVATYLAEKLDEEITLTESATDRGIKHILDIPKNKVILLENIRFHKEETECNEEFSRLLASYANIYVNDAFGTCHRKHASTYELNKYFKQKSYAGFLIQKEIKALDQIVKNPATPFYAIVGGAKVSDKIKIINKLLPLVQKLFIGGAMAYPFLKAKGQDIGKSLCFDEDVNLATSILREGLSSKIVLPIDHLVASSPDNIDNVENVDLIPNDKMALDIGCKSKELFKAELSDGKTILWNGPMGMFEKEVFSTGTFEIARILSGLNGFTLIGGGDSVSAINKSGLADKISHISTGGGASLEYIENGSLPGIDALKYGLE